LFNLFTVIQSKLFNYLPEAHLIVYIRQVDKVYTARFGHSVVAQTSKVIRQNIKGEELLFTVQDVLKKEGFVFIFSSL
jgi:hypothetical protein